MDKLQKSGSKFQSLDWKTCDLLCNHPSNLKPPDVEFLALLKIKHDLWVSSKNTLKPLT